MTRPERWMDLWIISIVALRCIYLGKCRDSGRSSQCRYFQVHIAYQLYHIDQLNQKESFHRNRNDASVPNSASGCSLPAASMPVAVVGEYGAVSIECASHNFPALVHYVLSGFGHERTSGWVWVY